MRHGFYRFVGGSEPQIEKQLIHRALDLWSWFWIGLEASVVFVLTGFAWTAFGLHQQGLIVILSALGSAAVGLPIIRSECRRYAIAQVRAIVADPARAELVRRAFEPLLSKRQSLPRAA